MMLSAALMLTTMPVTALTAYTQEGGACAHVCGDGTCDYVEGADCTHECGEDCADGCIHTEHEGECGYIEAVPCDHQHNADCGGLSGQQKPEGETGTVIASFATPAQTATVPLGTSYGDLPLPENLSATVEDEPDTADVPVEWTDDDGYDGDVPGDYGFTGELGAGYILADGVNAPTFTVTVENEVTQAVIITGFDEYPYSNPDDPYTHYIVAEPGTAAGDLPLPMTLKATAEIDGAEKDYTVAVDKWDCAEIIVYDEETWEEKRESGEYDPDEAGCYVFTPVLALNANESLADGVSLPSVEVFISGNIGIMALTQAGAFDITGGTLGTDYTYTGNALTITQNGTYAIGMTSAGTTTTTDRIAVQSGLTNVNITLNGVSIDVSGTQYACAFDMSGATVNLTLTGSNTLKSGTARAGLEVPRRTGGSSQFTSTLTITAASTGSLTAVGGFQGAGIGDGAHNSNYNFGTVNINGGTVNAQGGEYGAGIGDATNANGSGVVNISGGKVIATGGLSAAGIGGGAMGTTGGYGCTVTISGGTVVASGGRSGPGIGRGAGTSSPPLGTLTITGGSVLRNSDINGGAGREATATNGSNPVYRTHLRYLPAETAVSSVSGISGYGLNDVYTDGGGSLYFWLPVNSYTVVVETSGSRHFGTFTQATNNDNIWWLTDFVPVTGISGIPGEMIAGALELNGVVAPANATNKTIVWSVESAGSTGATISGSTLTTTAQGTVTVRATITDGLLSGNYPQDFTINIIADSLKVTGGTQGNDWEYNSGNVIIKTDAAMTVSGATTTKYVKVNSGVTANLTISDLYIDVSGQADYTAAFDITDATVNLTLTGTSTLKSAQYVAGLQAPSGSMLVITSGSTGSLTATGGSYGAGIGGGNNGGGGAITINSGTVTATGGDRGAGIGGGQIGAGGTTTITGGTVIARGGADGGTGGAGIGGGSYGWGGGTVNISGGAVNATGGYNGAGIGGGRYGAGGSINISGGTVIAAGGSNGAGIGSGGGATGGNGTLTVTGGSIRRSGTATREAARINGQGETVYLATLTVGDPPVANTAVTAGSIDGVLCTAVTPSGGEYGINDVVTDGAGKLYFWLPAGTDVPVTATAGGSLYANTVSPAAGDAAAGDAAAATLVIPAITNHPEDTTVTAGSITGALSVAANVPGLALSYQWYSNTGASNTDGTQVQGETGSSFTIPTDLTKGEYYYFCEITITETGATLRSNAATVTVQSSPAAAPTVPPEFDSKTAVSVTVKRPASVSEAVEFSIDGTAWQPSGTFSDLDPNTEYSFYMRYTETATHSASTASPALTVTTAKAVLDGAVTITGTAKFGEQLSADTTGLSSTPPVADLGTLSYEWKNNGGDTVLGTGANYTVQEGDIGKTITVTVTAANCSGSQTSGATSAVVKADQSAPATPTEEGKTDTSITLTAITGAEYRLSSGTWQDSPIFTELTANTGYTFYARLKATNTHNASPESAVSATITTLKSSQSAPIAPELDGNPTAENVTVKAPSSVNGTVEFACKTGAGVPVESDWENSGVFDNLVPNTEYSLYMRLAETNSYEASPASVALTVITNKAALGGSVTISGTERYGQTLTADTTGLSSTPSVADLGTLSYEWKNSGDSTVLGTGATYTVQEGDIGKTITVTVTVSNCSSSVVSDPTGQIAKADSPNAPTSVTGSYTGNGTTFTYTVNAIPGAEYKMDGGSWQDSIVFDNIAQASSHTFYARMKATTTHEAGAENNTGSVIFARLDDRTAPSLSYTISSDRTTITITEVIGAEYSFDSGTWGTSNNKSGYNGTELVSIQIRLAGTATHNPSPANSVSVDLNKGDQAAPPAFTMTYAYNSSANNFTVTIPTITNGEYSFDGITYNGTNTATANPGDFVTGYARYKETNDLNASPATASSLTLPVPVTSITVTGTGGADSITASGGTLQMLANVRPAGATQTVTWSISSGSGANISGSGLLTATANGTVTVRATTQDGTGVYGETAITITGQTPPTVSVTSISVSSNGSTISTRGGTMQMSASVLPANAINKTVTWSISDGSGAIVNNSGLLTATANGTVTIRATANDGSGIYGEKSITINGQSSGNNGGGGSSSSGDGSSGGGSPYTPTTPITTEKQPNMPTVAKVSVTGTIKDKVMTVNIITEKMAKDAIAAAEAAAKSAGKTMDGIAVQFNVTGSGNYVSLTATFERAALEALKTAGVKHVQIGSNIIDLTIDTKAITGILAQTTGNITVTATRQTKLSDAAKALIGNRPVFDITIKDGKGVTVSDLKGGTATIGIPYEPNSTEKTGSLFCVYVDSSGKPQLLTNSSYDNGKVIFGRSSLSIYAIGYKAPTPNFTDTANHWAKDNIDFVVSRDLISGTSATTFSPDAAITRADFLMALGKLSDANVSGYTTSSFTDVANTNPTMPYIEWAVQNKIVQDIGNNQFGPDRPISRQDIAVMMINYTKATGYTLPVSRQAVTFADDGSISAYAKDAVKAIQQAGIMSGKNNNLFDPQSNATRAEAATILRRFVELVIDEGTARGWVQNDAGQWQYFNTSGNAVTGLLNMEGNKYWFDDNGVMTAGKWIQISGKWYYFGTDGKLAASGITSPRTGN